MVENTILNGRNVKTASRPSIQRPNRREELEEVFTHALIDWDPLQQYLDSLHKESQEDSFW